MREAIFPIERERYYHKTDVMAT